MQAPRKGDTYLDDDSFSNNSQDSARKGRRGGKRNQLDMSDMSIRGFKLDASDVSSSCSEHSGKSAAAGAAAKQLQTGFHNFTNQIMDMKIDGSDFGLGPALASSATTKQEVKPLRL